MRLQRSHQGSFGASFDDSSKNCNFSTFTKVELLLMQNYLEELSNDAPKEPLRFLWSFIRWLLEELLVFELTKVQHL